MALYRVTPCKSCVFSLNELRGFRAYFTVEVTFTNISALFTKVKRWCQICDCYKLALRVSNEEKNC